MAGLLQEKELLGDDVPWLVALREKGRKAFEKQGVPSARTEDWKYTKPRDLNADDFVLNDSSAPEHHKECCCGEHECSCQKAQLPFEAYVISFENGIYCHQHSSFPRGVRVLPLIEALEDEVCHKNLGHLLDMQRHPFAALNTNYLEQGCFINIEKGICLDKPLVIFNHTSSENKNLFFNLRNLIVLEKNSSAEIIEYFSYSGAEKSRYFANSVNEIFVGRNAILKHYKFQNEAYKANHVALSVAQVKEGGQYKNFCLQRGANIGRNEVLVKLLENKAQAEVHAAYKMSGWATLDTTTQIEHLSEETVSDQLVKGVVDGEAKGVFQGKIHIAPHAIKTEGHQLHRALLLSDTAEVDCKPELEIYADDTKCSHGAATGELDEEQLFYMQSRGIDRDEARRILVEAFLDDVFLKIDSEEIRAWFKSMV